MNTVTLSSKISTLNYFSTMMQDGLTLSLLDHPSFNLSFFTSVGLEKPFAAFMEIVYSLENSLRPHFEELLSSDQAVTEELKSTGSLMIELDKVSDMLMDNVISKLRSMNMAGGY